MTPVLQHFQLQAFLSTLVSLVVAFLLGALIGFERQVRQRTAGLRTNTLVAVGAAIFVSLGERLYEIHGAGQGSPIQVVAYVISGIGFLGAGAIMKEGATISGLNTAATLWGSAAVGACAGSGLYAEAALGALFVLAANTLLRPVVNRINRSPLNEETSEATYSVYVICRKEEDAELRDRVGEFLDSATYPVREVESRPFDDNLSEIKSVLYATAVDPEQLDRLMTDLELLPGVERAFWNSSAED